MGWSQKNDTARRAYIELLRERAKRNSPTPLRASGPSSPPLILASRSCLTSLRCPSIPCALYRNRRRRNVQPFRPGSLNTSPSNVLPEWIQKRSPARSRRGLELILPRSKPAPLGRLLTPPTVRRAATGRSTTPHPP